MSDLDLVAKHWPHVAALHGALAQLTSQEHVVKAKDDKHRPAATEDELFDRFVARLNRTGGPKLSPRAIAQ